MDFRRWRRPEPDTLEDLAAKQEDLEDQLREINKRLKWVSIMFGAVIVIVLLCGLALWGSVLILMHEGG